MRVISISAYLFYLNVFLFPFVARSEIFYAIDSNNDKLIRFNTETSNLTEVGPLGVDIVHSDGLVTLSSEELFGIFIVEAEPTVQSYYFYRVSALTGNATFVAEVIDGDGNPENNLAEALALQPQTGEVFISFSSGAFSSSDILGVVNTDTGLIEQRCVIGVDMDNLLFDATGSLLALDIFPPIDKDFYRINVDACTATLLSKSAFVPILGLGFLADGSLVGTVGEPELVGGRSLAKLDTSTGEIGEVVATISSGYLIRDITSAEGITTCEDDLTACQTDLEDILANLEACQEALNTCQQDLAGVGNLMDEIELDFQAVFEDPGFRISGATTLERFQNLTAAVLGLNKGAKRQLFNSLVSP